MFWLYNDIVLLKYSRSSLKKNNQSSSIEVDCKYTKWNDWTPCNALCEQTRSRSVDGLPTGDSKHCDELDQSRGCIGGRCTGK